MHRGNKENFTYQYCVKCKLRKRMIRTATFQNIGEPELKVYKRSILSHAIYEYIDDRGVHERMPECYSKNELIGVRGNISLFDLEKERNEKD